MEEKVDFAVRLRLVRNKASSGKMRTFTLHRVHFLLEGLKYSQSLLTRDGKELAILLTSVIHFSVASASASPCGQREESERFHWQAELFCVQPEI